MGRANRSFGDRDIPRPPGFNPGGEDFGVIRTIDGRDPADGSSNVHVPYSDVDPDWDEPVGAEEGIARGDHPRSEGGLG